VQQSRLRVNIAYFSFHKLLTATCRRMRETVASLRLASPGAATEGVTPIFPETKLTTFFSHHRLSVCLLVLQCRPYLFFSLKNRRPSLLITVTSIDFTVVSPPWRVLPTHFLPVRPVNLSTIFFRSCVTPWRVSSWAVPLWRPPVTPLKRE